MHRGLFLLLTGMLVSPLCSSGETDQAAFARATAAIQAATLRAQADPLHPVFHVASPAQWMNDPNGPIFYRGYYHLFYQLTPFGDESGVKYWGHVRSRNLVEWEQLPIALAPAADQGEASIWSGCCTINGEGRPMIFYTSIGEGKSPFDQAQQWAAFGDADLIHWQKYPTNPILPAAANAGTNIYDWRDPFVFHASDKTFLVLGGHLTRTGDAAVNIYEAENPSLTQWKYRGVLFHIPAAPTAECPNFFQLGQEWVLLVSPYGRVQYYLGNFDAKTCRFTARTNGILDYGSNFYAPNTMQVPDGRRLLWGWINGFPAGRGWNGCLSLPRELKVFRDGRLGQIPAPQLAALRGQKTSWRNLPLNNGVQTIGLPQTNTLEIMAEINLSPATSLQVALKNSTGDELLLLDFDGVEIRCQNNHAPLSLGADGRLELRIFVDRGVIEVFANETVCFTTLIKPLTNDASLEMRAPDGRAKIKCVDVWPIKQIWLESPIKMPATTPELHAQ